MESDRQPLVMMWAKPTGAKGSFRISSCDDYFDTAGDGTYCN